MNLKRKVVLITGIGKGIGNQIFFDCVKNADFTYGILRNQKDLKLIKKKINNKKCKVFVGDIKNQTISNTDLTFLLNKRAKELNITVPKCATCKNPCSSCKIKFLKKEFKLNAQKPAITSSIEAFKTKRKLEKFWG